MSSIKNSLLRLNVLCGVVNLLHYIDFMVIFVNKNCFYGLGLF